MANTKLKRVFMRNWGSIKESTIEFPDAGLVVVHGVNLAAKGKFRSIGAGKSLLGEALGRTLFGVPGRFTQLGHYSPGRDTLVVLDCTHNDKDLRIELGFKAKELDESGEALRWTYDGQQVWRDKIRNTRDDLTKLVTVPTSLAEWSVFLDGDKLKFDGLSQRSAVDLLMSSLAQPAWTDFHGKANKATDALKKDCSNGQIQLNNLGLERSEMETSIESAQQALAEAKKVYEDERASRAKKRGEAQTRKEAVQKEIGEVTAEMKRITKEIDQLVKDHAQERHTLEVAVNEARDARSDALRAKDAAQMQYDHDSRSKAQIESQLAAARKGPGICVTCRRPFAEKEGKAQLIEQLQTTLAQWETAVTTSMAALTSKTAQVKKAEKALEQANTKLNEAKERSPVQQLSHDYEKAEGHMEQLKEDLEDATQALLELAKDPDRSEIYRYEATVTERTAQLQKIITKVEAAAAKLTEDQDALAVTQYWANAFSPNGIPNMVLTDAIGPLNDTSRRISALMTGGCINVRYETSRALATGRQKAELNIVVENVYGSSRAEGSSKGEGGLVNLIVAETLAEVGGVAHRIGYRFYDEIASNVDEQVRRSTFAYLKELATKNKILVFIVTHSPEAASYADYVLTAEKTAEDGTRYTWG